MSAHLDNLVKLLSDKPRYRFALDAIATEATYKQYRELLATHVRLAMDEPTLTAEEYHLLSIVFDYCYTNRLSV